MANHLTDGRGLPLKTKKWADKYIPLEWLGIKGSWFGASWSLLLEQSLDDILCLLSWKTILEQDFTIVGSSIFHYWRALWKEKWVLQIENVKMTAVNGTKYWHEEVCIIKMSVSLTRASVKCLMLMLILMLNNFCFLYSKVTVYRWKWQFFIGDIILTRAPDIRVHTSQSWFAAKNHMIFSLWMFFPR